MKTLLTFATTVLLIWAASAAFAAPPAIANFTSERGQAFSLALDGRLLTRPLARQVRVGQLMPGQHWADFSLPTAYGPPLRFRTAVWLQPGVETSYVLLLRPGYGPQLRQVSAVALYGPAYGPGGYGGGYQPQPQPGSPYGTGPSGPYGGYANGSPNGRNNYPAYPNTAPYGGQNGPYGTAPAPNYPGGYGQGNAPAPGNPNAGYPGNPAGGGYNQGAPGGLNQNQNQGQNALQPADVQGLTQDLQARTSDEERVDLAKQALDQRTVRADELAQLLNTLADDGARIELAEFGYEHVSDPANFYRVYDALRSPANVREVQQALGLPQR